MVCRGLLSRETVECYPTLLWCFLSGQAQWVSLRLRFAYCAQLDIVMTELKHLGMEEWTREWEEPPQAFFSFFQLVKDLFQRARLSDRQAGREAGAGRKWVFLLLLLHSISLNKHVAHPGSLHPGPLQFVLDHSPENAETREEFSLLDNGALNPLSIGSLWILFSWSERLWSNFCFFSQTLLSSDTACCFVFESYSFIS